MQAHVDNEHKASIRYFGHTSKVLDLYSRDLFYMYLKYDPIIHHSTTIFPRTCMVESKTVPQNGMLSIIKSI